MHLEDYDIGYSGLSDKVYLGKSKVINNQGHREWIHKKDITKRFNQVMLQKVQGQQYSIQYVEAIKKLAEKELGMYDLSEILDDEVLTFFFKYIGLNLEYLEMSLNDFKDLKC